MFFADLRDAMKRDAGAFNDSLSEPLLGVNPSELDGNKYLPIATMDELKIDYDKKADWRTICLLTQQ